MKIVARENGVSVTDRFRRDEELLFLAGLPKILEVAVPTGAFIAEISAVNSFAFGDESDTVFLSNLLAINGFTAAVPDAEDDTALGRAIDLHSKISTMPAAGHVVGPERIFHPGHFAVEGGDFGASFDGIGKVHRSGIASGLHVEVHVPGGRPIEDERFDGLGGLGCGEGELLEAGLCDMKDPKISDDRSVFFPRDGGLGFLVADGEGHRDGVAFGEN